MKKAIIVTDLGFGDCGKGTMTDYFARKFGAHTVIRANGGSQAAHNVVAPDGRHHTFSQFGAATFVPGVETYLSKYMLVNPGAMLAEARKLAEVGITDAFERTHISHEALVITPFQIAVNRLKEIARGAGRHGSCGNGISETAADALTLGNSVPRIGEIGIQPTMLRKLRFLQRHKRAQARQLIEQCKHYPQAALEIATLMDESVPEKVVAQWKEFVHRADWVGHEFIEGLLQKDGVVVFEGAQGVLLDEWRGFHPYTTWSTCTDLNPHALLTEYGYDGETETVGVVRAYSTRHGAGPFVTEDAELTKRIPDVHNKTDDWQEGFRVGWFDAVATRYAISCCRYEVTSLAMTCTDRLMEIDGDWKYCNEYDTSALAPFERDALFKAHPIIPWHAREIKLGPARDLSYQETVTEALGQIKPFYGEYLASQRTPERRVDDYAALISEFVHVPVRWISSGMTAGDKREVVAEK